MSSLREKFLILLYENDKLLNSILHYQISNYKNFSITSILNISELFEIISEKTFDTCIFNLNHLTENNTQLLDLFLKNNKNTNIIGYFKSDFGSFEFNTSKLIPLKKPFKLITLFNHLDNIKALKNLDYTNKYLMKHIIFSPSKKIISNQDTNKTEHLTEKENKLLIYFYNKKNVKILKKDLLTKIWGFSDEINTHTLETHIYRLKQKLYRLDNNLSFSLINKNGLYCLKHEE